MKPWKKLDSKTLISDRWLTLRADRCELPNGVIVEPYYVMEEKEWINIFALDAQNRLLLVRQYRYAANVMCTELPGGAVEGGEDPLQAAKRELREETGYSARNWLQIGALFANPARQTNRLHTFLARDLVREGSQELDEAEEMAVSFAEIAEVHDMIRSGEFPQALHVASFYLGCQAAFGKSLP